jgi:hypothetical protein
MLLIEVLLLSCFKEMKVNENMDNPKLRDGLYRCQILFTLIDVHSLQVIKTTSI